MELTDNKKQPDINEGVAAFREKSNALLPDVRTREEYTTGHIDGSINIPVQSLGKIVFKVKNRSTPIYVYCHSGARSARAAKALRDMGYSDVTDIGGIKDYGDN